MADLPTAQPVGPVQIILRESNSNTRKLELFIGNPDKSKVYSIGLRKQVMWIYLILRNITKHTRLDD